MKLMIGIGVTLFGSIGTVIGAAMSHGNEFGGWAILLGTIGSFFGIYAGYKAAQYTGL